MWKRLLVGLDGSAWAESAATHALAFAKLCDAEVEAVFVADARMATPPMPAADMLGAPIDLPVAPFAAALEDERRRGEAVLRAFAERARAAGARAVTIAETGVPARMLLARLRGADAVFLGREGRSGAARVGSIVRDVGRESVRPVFVAQREPREVRRALVAYDGSDAAMRALRVACEVADRGRAGLAFALLTVGEDAALARATQDQAATFAGAHGVVAERLVRAGPPAASICAAAREGRFDLVIAGGFQHGRIHDWLVGSVTGALLETCDVPLLIHH
jgi:nucleotide-binding universal stress UspA family protein